MQKVAIVGAGISGLTIAQKLKQNANITIFEKSRGVSGRVATRRAEPYFFDHGAQFFKAKKREFKEFIEPMIKEGVIAPWKARFAEIEGEKVVRSHTWTAEQPNYVGTPSMSAIGKYLSEGLDIQKNVRIQSIEKQKEKWLLRSEEGNEFTDFDWIIFAIPAKQLSDVLPDSFSFFSKVKQVKMKACFSLMLGFEEPLSLDYDAALVRFKDISWISVNSSKPKREGNYSLLIHSTNDWADKHFDEDRKEILEYLIKEASLVTGIDLNTANHKDIHGWRFANIEKQTGESYYCDEFMKIAACGDWFIHGRIESAFLSAFYLCEKIKENFK